MRPPYPTIQLHHIYFTATAVSGENSFVNFWDENENFNLMFRDKNENENIFLSVSCFEMRTRISFFQSQASRRERESRLRQLSQECSRMFKNAFILLVSGLIVYNTEKAVNFSKILLIFSQEILMKISRWEQEYFLSISCFKTRTRNRKWFLKVEREKMKPRGNFLALPR